MRGDAGMSQSSCEDDGAAQRQRPVEGSLDSAAAASEPMDSSVKITIPGFESNSSERARREVSSTYRNLTVGVTDNTDLLPQFGEASPPGRSHEEYDYASATLLEEWDRFRVEEKLQQVQPHGPDIPLPSKERERLSSVGAIDQRLKLPLTPSGKPSAQSAHVMSRSTAWGCLFLAKPEHGH